jgi:phospholipase/carboxylesterase
MTSGIHHLTLITRKVQANVDFYAGFLGLRIVKRTGGTPGSLITFLVWEDGSKGRVGHGQVSEIALSIDRTAIGFWLERALRYHIQSEGPVQEFGEPVLRLRDPDGVIVKLVGSDLAANDPWSGEGIPAEFAIRQNRLSLLSSAISAFTVRGRKKPSTGLFRTPATPSMCAMRAAFGRAFREPGLLIMWPFAPARPMM